MWLPRMCECAGPWPQSQSQSPTKPTLRVTDKRKKTFADEYEIDPTKNDGVAHQYDAVVRSRDERRKMHGGDCECCRDVSGPI